MKFTDLIPYYSDLKIAGLLACSYVAALAGLLAMFAVSRILKLKFGFERAACFCLIASGLLWMLPVLPLVKKEYSNLELLAILCAFLPLMRFVYGVEWRAALALWLAYGAVQISLYLYLIN